jgi:hypothetical protein
MFTPQPDSAGFHHISVMSLLLDDACAMEQKMANRNTGTACSVCFIIISPEQFWHSGET